MELNLNILNDLVIPITSILAFIISVLSLFVNSLINRRRLIVSKPHQLRKFSLLKESQHLPDINASGIILIFTIYNPSPHNIGIGNFKFFDRDNEVFNDVTSRKNSVLLNGFLHVTPNTESNFVIKANSQKRITFLFRENELQSFSYTDFQIRFNAIYYDYFSIIKNPIQVIKLKRPLLKTYYVKGKVITSPIKREHVSKLISTLNS